MENVFMHPSMVKLYQAAKDSPEKIEGQSALARKMGESPQTVKNWESRGISERGARIAQELFGCDVNELMSSTNTHKIYSSKATKQHRVQQETQLYGWPFYTVSPHQFSLLNDDEKSHIEETILLFVKKKDSTEKQETPENMAASS